MASASSISTVGQTSVSAASFVHPPSATPNPAPSPSAGVFQTSRSASRYILPVALGVVLGGLVVVVFSYAAWQMYKKARARSRGEPQPEMGQTDRLSVWRRFVAGNSRPPGSQRIAEQGLLRTPDAERAANTVPTSTNLPTIPESESDIREVSR